MRLGIRLVLTALAIGGLAVGCDNGGGGGTDGGTDGGATTDGGPCANVDPNTTRPDPMCVMCPAMNTPAPEEQMGSCCYRHSNAGVDTPEFRLTYIDITAPEGSPLTQSLLTSVLAQSMQEEHFNWLVRVGGTSDGSVDLVTGFGRRQDDGTYQFSQGAAGSNGDPDTWCPVTMAGTLSGDSLTSQAAPSVVTVPIYDTTGTTLQLELSLRQVQIDNATWGEDNSCVGWKLNLPYRYHTDATLSGYIDVASARDGMINVAPITTTVCSAIAGSLTDATYCDQDQSAWMVKPDSLCDDTGCMVNSAGMTDVCDPATTCNAWHIVADFAASGVDITNGACGA